MEKPASPELPSSMNFKPGESGRISISGLKSRGWTDKTVREFLGMADWTTDNPHYKNAAPMLLYDTHRVEQAEQDPWFQRRKRGGKNSRRPIPDGRRQQHGSIPQHPASAVGHSTNGL